MTLLTCKNVRIERIVSSSQVDAKEYCQTEDEWVVLLKGEATLEIEGRQVKLAEGDYLYIPASTRHQIVDVQHGTLWLAVHVG